MTGIHLEWVYTAAGKPTLHTMGADPLAQPRVYARGGGTSLGYVCVVTYLRERYVVHVIALRNSTHVYP